MRGDFAGAAIWKNCLIITKAFVVINMLIVILVVLVASTVESVFTSRINLVVINSLIFIVDYTPVIGLTLHVIL